jgi:acyl-coenzyme A synthetase/AMP-(fatty) acid ligase/alkanesulfonate monooxygenase SsuD/methylene tetrahydromethanopterin reductase-like flavin-dependent oxidoreductase (luciferase family)
MSAGGPSIGVRIPQYGSSWAEIRTAAIRAEELGFDGVWANDHLQSPGRRKDDPAFDAFVTLAAVAEVTRRVRLGTVVLSASYRGPALTAKMATILDVISDGRLVVGLGAGSNVEEHRAFGVPFGTPAQRTDGLRTTFETMRAMFAGTSGPGVHAPPNQPPPSRPGGPPIWIAAHRPRLLRLAGERADGIVAAFHGPEVVAQRLAIAEEARLRAGRPPLACAFYTFVLPVPSQREAEAWVGREAAALGTTPRGYLRWMRSTGLVAEPGALRERIAEYGRAGVTDVVLVLPSRVPPEALEALAAATLPAAPPAAAERRERISADAGPSHNLVTLLVERQVRTGLGEHPAAIDETGTWAYAELSRAAARAAGALAGAGVRRGDRVVVALRDGRDWFQAFLGAARMGAVPVPVDPTADRARLAEVVDDCEPAAIVAEQDAARVGGCLALTPAQLDAGPPAPVAAVHPEDLAYLIYSSGSTGRPKGAMHSHQDMRVGIETYAREVLGLGPGDRCHSMARLFTSLGFGNGFFRVLGSGATAVLSGVLPTPRAVLGTVARHQVNVLTAVPTFWAQLARFLERHPDPGALAAVRLAVSSGDSLPATVAERLRTASGLDLIEGLGCSECSNIVISTRPGEPVAPGSLGRAVEGVEIRLADDEGRPVDSGEPGRLWIRSASNTTGYWRRVEETRDLVMGPWLRMGDVLTEDADGYRHLGRSDDLFKVDARWVSPTAVEAVLVGHPAVAEAAVVARADGDGLPRPAAYVVLSPGAAAEGLASDLRRLVAGALGAYTAPQSVTIMTALPRLPSGKLDRRTLRQG